MIYFGVDPGLKGGISAIHNNMVLVTPMPVTDSRDIDVFAVCEWICKVIDCSHPIPYASVCYIEQVSAMPGNGVVSMFKFGFVTGKIEGIFQAMKIPIQRIHPIKWKNEILGKAKHDKQAAIDFCLREYPQINLTVSRTSHDGIADSLCIATYARRIHK